MPIYVFRCSFCGEVFEEFRHNSKDNTKAKCPQCGFDCERAMDKENVNMRPDIEEGYNLSLGKHVSSRRELREAAAFHNALLPDLMTNSYPSDGRLCKEERLEAEGINPDKRNVFDWRKQPGWGDVPPEADITVDGTADYEPIKKHIKQKHEERRKMAHG